MRCYIRCLLFIILGVCLTSRLDAGDAPAKQQVHRPGHAAMRLWIEAAAETLYLPHHHIEPHSLAMEWMGRRWLCGDSLRLEPSLGFLILPFAAPAADSAVIEYNYLPIDLPVMYSHRRIEESTGGEAPKVVEERKSPRNAQPDTKLNISGSKTFSVEMGSQQDLAVDQTLDLTITGRVSSNVKVQAILTDRETPLQPEGTTRELEDLDKVYLRIEAPDAQLDLGDLEIEESGLRLASFQRQLEGVDGRVRIGSHETHAVGAVSRGRFRSLEFFGAEGRQGPYALLGREEDGVIVAGSEVVWLDGQKLQRGETESYIIDYSLGELTFTSRHPMSERSEIVVDFEVSLESYRRSLYSLALRSVIPGSRGLWRILYLREQDDRAHPLGLVLSDEESSLLEEVGDGIAPGLDSGIQYVGPLHGDYAKVEVDTVSQAIFRYMGPDSGSYVVHFVEVGDGSGDYLEAHTYGVTYYVYAGENKGDYKPGRAVPRPVALEVGDISLVLERGLARVEAEGAFSRYDRNAFSDKDDGDNVDGAYTINTTLKSPMLRILGGEIGHFETRLRARQVGDRYQAPGRLQSGFYEKEWNAPSGTLNGREREQGAELRLVATEKVNVGAGWDRLESWSGFEARRLTADFAMASWARLEGRMTRVASEDSIGLKGERSTERIRVADKNGRLDFTYLRENSTWGKGATATGYQFRDLDATVRRGQPDRGLNLRARINWRRHWVLNGGKEQRDNDGLTTELESEWRGTPSFRAGALFVRRKLHSYTENPGRTTYLGQLNISQSLWNGAWTTQWRTEATSQAVKIRDQIITFVGENLGHYDALGRYIGVGDYEVFYNDLGAEELQSILDVTGKWTAAPGKRVKERRHPTGNRWVNEAEWSFYLRTRVESPEKLTTIIAEPGRWWGRHGEASSGSGNIRSDIRLLTRTPEFSPTIRWEGKTRINRSPNGIEEREQTKTLQLSATSSPHDRLRLEGKQMWTDEERRTSLGSFQGLSDTAGLIKRRTELTAVYRVIRMIRLRLQTAAVSEREETITRRHLWELTPGLVLNLTGGRAELRVKRLWATGDETTSRIFNLEKPGWTVRATADLRLQKYIDLNYWLESHHPDEGKAVVSSRVSVRAIF